MENMRLAAALERKQEALEALAAEHAAEVGALEAECGAAAARATSQVRAPLASHPADTPSHAPASTPAHSLEA